MRITDLAIFNYKSLRAVTMTPQPLSVIVGANASGKSNFADAIDFIAEVYQHGLEVAVERKGGYENIAFRRQRRSRAPVEIQLAVELSADDLTYLLGIETKNEVRIEHSFAFVARESSIRAAFVVNREHLLISEKRRDIWQNTTDIERLNQNINIKVPEERQLHEAIHNGSSSIEGLSSTDSILLRILNDTFETASPAELFVSSLGQILTGIRILIRAMGNVRVFQISPSNSRNSGVPTPQPELERLGGNLPAVIDSMRKNNPAEWDLVMGAMRGIMPDISDIEVNYTSSKRLGLFFREEGVGRPWSVEQVSDGTIRTLALLVAIFDPTSTALVLEEPENSVHPWVIRRILDACRQASAKKPIILTTHSPIVINAVRPEEVWVIWREKGESRLAELSKLDPEFLPLWKAGSVPTFEYIDSGALLEAIPPAPSSNGALDESGVGAR